MWIWPISVGVLSTKFTNTDISPIDMIHGLSASLLENVGTLTTKLSNRIAYQLHDLSSCMPSKV